MLIGEERNYMAFLLETFRGFIALIGIPFAIALFLEIRRIGGLSALEQRLHPKKSPPEYNKDEENIFQESNFERNVKPRSTRPYLVQPGREVYLRI